MVKQDPINRLLDLIRPHRSGYILSILLAVLGVSSGMVPYFAVAQIVNLLLNGETAFSVYLLWCGIALAAFVPAGTIMARDLADTPAETRALPDLPADLTVPAVPPLAPQSLPVTSPTERFTRPDAGDMETLMRDVRLRSTAPAAQTETPQGAGDAGSGEDGPVEDVPSQAVPDAVPYEDLYVIPRTETGKSSVTAPVQAPARTETRPAGTTTPGSFYLGTIQRAGFFELLLHDNAVYALHSDGSELLLPDSVQAEPVLGSDLSYVAISPAQEADLKVPTGLYIFAADGTEKAFLKSAHADHCKALYLSPDGTVLAIDMGGDVNHHLVLYAWPSQQPLDVELFYYPGKTVDMARAQEMTRRAEKAAAAACLGGFGICLPSPQPLADSEYPNFPGCGGGRGATHFGSGGCRDSPCE